METPRSPTSGEHQTVGGRREGVRGVREGLTSKAEITHPGAQVPVGGMASQPGVTETKFLSTHIKTRSVSHAQTRRLSSEEGGRSGASTRAERTAMEIHPDMERRAFLPSNPA